MIEYWDLYDKNRKLLNKIHKRGVPIPKGCYRIVVDVWTINHEGQILIDKRHPNKHLGGLWECAGGSILAGESSEEGAIRELEEELGIKVNLNDLSLIHQIRLEDRFVDTYLVKKDVKINDLIFEKNEVIEAKYVSIEELDRIYQQNKLAVSRYPFYREQIISKLNEKTINK